MRLSLLSLITMSRMPGTYFSPDPAGAGGAGGADPTVTDPPTEPVVPEMSDEVKAYIAKTTADATAKAIAEATATAKAEAKAEYEKEQKAASRKLALDKAKEDGNKEEELRLAKEATAEAQAERDRIAAEAKATKDESVKIRIAAKHKLPDGYHLRLLGSTEAEWETDATELAKGLPVTATKPNLEGGKQGTGTAEQQKKAAQKATVPALSIF